MSVLQLRKEDAREAAKDHYGNVIGASLMPPVAGIQVPALIAIARRLCFSRRLLAEGAMRAFLATAWRTIAPGGAHYVRAYNLQTILHRLRRRNRSEALAWSIGGAFEEMGALEKAVLLRHGLTDGMTLIDVGCGPGRLAYALCSMPIGYTGTDVVPELLGHARSVCGRDDWQFRLVDRLEIPAPSRSADFVTFFSVFTHLRHPESYRYLLDARRVLKPGGTAVFSFLDFTIPEHWPLFEERVKYKGLRAKLRPVINTFMDRAALPIWAEHLGLELVAIEDRAIGQSVCVMRKPVTR